jgi:hypothetical protein
VRLADAGFAFQNNTTWCTGDGVAPFARGVRRFPYPDAVDRLATALGLDDIGRATLVSLRRRSMPVDRRPPKRFRWWDAASSGACSNGAESPF